MSKGLKRFLTIVITFFATLLLAAGAVYAYVLWFDYNCDILIGNDVDVTGASGSRFSFIDTLSDTDLAAADSILSGAGISYQLGGRNALVLVRGCDEKKAVQALVNSGYDFEGIVSNAYDL